MPSYPGTSAISLPDTYRLETNLYDITPAICPRCVEFLEGLPADFPGILAGAVGPEKA